MALAVESRGSARATPYGQRLRQGGVAAQHIALHNQIVKPL